MKVVGADRIEYYILKHANSKSALETWLAEARQAKWTQPQDIKNRYRPADFLSGNRVIFVTTQVFSLKTHELLSDLQNIGLPMSARLMAS